MRQPKRAGFDLRKYQGDLGDSSGGCSRRKTRAAYVVVTVGSGKRATTVSGRVPVPRSRIVCYRFADYCARVQDHVERAYGIR